MKGHSEDFSTFEHCNSSTISNVSNHCRQINTSTLTLNENAIVTLFTELEKLNLGQIQTGFDSSVSLRLSNSQLATFLIRGNDEKLYQFVLLFGNQKWRCGASVSLTALKITYGATGKENSVDDLLFDCSCDEFRTQLQCRHQKLMVNSNSVRKILWVLLYRSVHPSIASSRPDEMEGVLLNQLEGDISIVYQIVKRKFLGLRGSSSATVVVDKRK